MRVIRPIYVAPFNLVRGNKKNRLNEKLFALPELRRLAAGRGANAAVITSQQNEHVGQNTSTFTLGFGTPFIALPTYSNSQSRDVYIQKMSATLVKLK